ncbi:hypothetical protein RHGRI_013115 [Rhododendron griersonianum]|uniref:Uncharacterized protein n=1 Tax=Rhododendron griersonianum TaxID=479676 RepID=A0AAV6K4C7_9ERIC|nr:hypothetical protein RHGRI_013115 [Rhododendron griersonianum]
MEICRVNSLVVMAIMALVLALVIPSINAHAPVPAPAPAPTSDGDNFGCKLVVICLMNFDKLVLVFAGIGLDQGIAYMLMVVALVLTYIIH